VKADEQEARGLEISWENVKAIFPYGLPASLQCGDQRPSCDSNVIDFERFRAHRRPPKPSGAADRA
jgi:hypothetical protein